MWITAARPLSDVPGLAAALFVQWLLVRARTVRELAFAALAAGLAAGIRSQVVWLTVPLLLLIVVSESRGMAARGGSVDRGRLRRRRADLGRAAAGAVGRAGRLLERSRVPGRRRSLRRRRCCGRIRRRGSCWPPSNTRFLHPWGWWPLGGSRARLRRRRRDLAARGLLRVAAATLAAAFGPYLIFDMLFQETVTTRYALPLVVPVAFAGGDRARRGDAPLGSLGRRWPRCRRARRSAQPTLDRLRERGRAGLPDAGRHARRDRRDSEPPVAGDASASGFRSAGGP